MNESCRHGRRLAAKTSIAFAADIKAATARLAATDPTATRRPQSPSIQGFKATPKRKPPSKPKRTDPPTSKAEYMRQYRNRPEVKARTRAYNRRPEVVARRRELRQRPEAKAKAADYEADYSQRPEVKERRADYQRDYRNRPEVKEWHKAYDAARNARPEIKAARNERLRAKREAQRLAA